MNLAFLTYNRDPSIPNIDNDGNPVTVRNYSYWLAKFGHQIDIFVNRVVPNETSVDYIKKKFSFQKADSLELFPKVKVMRVDTPEIIAKKLFSSVELQEIPEIIQSTFAASYFSNKQLMDYDLVCIFHPLTSFGVIFRNFVPLEKTILFPMLLSNEYLKFGEVSPIYIQLEQSVLKNVAKIFSTSLSEKEVLISRGLNKDKIEVVSRGIDLSSFNFVPRTSPEGCKAIQLITIGSLRPQKRQHILIDVVERLISKGFDVNLKVVGENKLFTKSEYKEYYKQIKSDISKKELSDKISFVGGVEPTEVFRLLSSADIALFPSISESFGKAALESICVGTPTILAKECLAYNDFSENEENALLVPSDPESMTNAVIKLLDNKYLYSELSSNGFSTRNRFSWEIVSRTLNDALERARKS